MLRLVSFLHPPSLTNLVNSLNKSKGSIVANITAHAVITISNLNMSRNTNQNWTPLVLNK